TTAEDVDFSHRLLKKHPSKIAYAPAAVLFHRVRSTPQELAHLAQTYGQGVARMYKRYSDEVQWDGIKTAKIRGRLALREFITAGLRAGQVVRLVSSEKVEFSQCHLLWLRNFSQGFFSEYYPAAQRAVVSK
ncbi:MAG: hypothetical protein M3Z41_10075, partial [Candidatus Eremiobacteraeota bacterium]|nr:hypothetical protein [Candidatus Eremiobacteraeota bacterium]